MEICTRRTPDDHSAEGSMTGRDFSGWEILLMFFQLEQTKMNRKCYRLMYLNYVFDLFSYVCVCVCVPVLVCMCVCVCVTPYAGPMKVRKGIWFPGIIGDCQPPNLGPGDWNQIFWKNRKLSKLLSDLSIPRYITLKRWPCKLMLIFPGKEILVLVDQIREKV